MSPSRGIFQIDTDNSILHRINSIPALRAFLISLALFLLCVLYGRANFYRDPGSIFFDEDRASERWYSAYRERQAEKFIDSISQYSWNQKHSRSLPPLPKANANASMCAVFLTVAKQPDMQHLEASLGSLLEGLTAAERADINIQIFFANSDPSNHSSWYKPWLRPLVDKVYTYADLYSFEGMADVLALERAGPAAIGKPPLDYALALQQCVHYSNARYIAVLEDDIIAADSWFARALWAAREVDRKMWKQNRLSKWIYVRLFNQERATGWNTSRIGIDREIPVSLAAAGFVYGLLVLVRRRLRSSSRATKPQLDKATMLVICLVAVPSFVVLFFQCGKASVLPPSPGVKEERLGCCTEALIFNRDHVPGLVMHLHGAAALGEHHQRTREFGSQYGLAEFSLYPAMIQHVGGQPPMQTTEAESSKVWSMAFESLNPRRLQRDHVNFVKHLYGSNAISWNPGSL